MGSVVSHFFRNVNLNFCQKVRRTWSWLSRSCRRLFAQLILQHNMLVEFIYCTGHVPSWPGGFEFIPLGGPTLVKFPANLSLLGMNNVVLRCRSHWLDQRGHRDQLYGSRDVSLSSSQPQAHHDYGSCQVFELCMCTLNSFCRPFTMFAQIPNFKGTLLPDRPFSMVDRATWWETVASGLATLEAQWCLVLLCCWVNHQRCHRQTSNIAISESFDRWIDIFGFWLLPILVAEPAGRIRFSDPVWICAHNSLAFCLGLQSVAPGDLLCILPGVMATVTERKEQVATWNGDPVLWQDYVKRVRLQYERTPVKKRSLLGAELASRLTGRAWDVASADLDHQRLQKPDGPAY